MASGFSVIPKCEHAMTHAAMLPVDDEQIETFFSRGNRNQKECLRRKTARGIFHVPE
jgi:hypothetical protein